MTNNELLLAMSDMMDKKLVVLENKIGVQINDLHGKMNTLSNDLHGKMDTLSNDLHGKMNTLSNDLHGKMDTLSNDLYSKMDTLSKDIVNIKLIIENELRPNIKLLAKNYIPAAKQYEKTSHEIESLKSDVSLLKMVVTEHSDKLQKIS